MGGGVSLHTRQSVGREALGEEGRGEEGGRGLQRDEGFLKSRPRAR